MEKVIASVLFACVCVGLVLASLHLDLWTCRYSAMLPQPMAVSPKRGSGTEKTPAVSLFGWISSRSAEANG